MLGPSWLIIPSRKSCLRSRRAVRGRLPQRKNRFRGSLVESLEALEADFIVVVEDFLLCFAENQGGESTKKSGRSIEKLNAKRGSRIAAVDSG